MVEQDEDGNLTLAVDVRRYRECVPAASLNGTSLVL